MQLQGAIKVIGDVQHVSDKFRKREIVITTDGQYPQHIPIQLTQDKTELIANYQIGDVIKVDINIRGREHQGKYYSNIEGWRIELISNGQGQSGAVNTNDDLPL